MNSGRGEANIKRKTKHISICFGDNVIDQLIIDYDKKHRLQPEIWVLNYLASREYPKVRANFLEEYLLSGKLYKESD